MAANAGHTQLTVDDAASGRSWRAWSALAGDHELNHFAIDLQVPDGVAEAGRWRRRNRRGGEECRSSDTERKGFER
jgi:hypothetical protein